MSLSINTAKMQKQIDLWRDKITKAIKDITVDYLHGSGYSKGIGENGCLRLCTYPDSLDSDGYTMATYISTDETDADAFAIMGFTEQGVINDAYCGLVTTDYEDLTLEQLIWVYDNLKETHTSLQ